MGKVEREQHRNAFLAAAREKNELPIGVTSISQLEKSFMIAVRGCTTYQHVREICGAMEILKERIPPQKIAVDTVPLSAEFKYKSTPDGSPPTGRRKKDTFRDVGFSGMRPEAIDEIDCECIQQGISRAEWITLNAFGIGSTKESQRRFYMLTEGSKDHRTVKLRQTFDGEFTSSEIQDVREPY